MMAASTIASAGLKLGVGAVASVSSRSSKSSSVRGGASSFCCSSSSSSSSLGSHQFSPFTSAWISGDEPVSRRRQGSLRREANRRAPHVVISFSSVDGLRSMPRRRPAENGFTRGAGFHVAAALATETSGAPKVDVEQWTWNYEGKEIIVHVQEYGQALTKSAQTVLMLPTLSDVSTTDEWQAVAEGLLSTVPGGFKIVVVDWPGLGLSERPPLNYTADVLEKFLADFMSSYKGLRGSSEENLPVIVGAGHSATLAARALSKGLVKARALVAVAPTWAGPLPIVFGRDSKMEFRYNLLRNTLRSPGIGWAMYKFLVSSEKNIRMQYLNHVYADANNVTRSMVESRTDLTRRDGARFAPAAFLTGLLDPTNTREELLELFSKLNGTVPTLVMSTAKAPKRSRREMEALNGAVGVKEFITIPGALLPHEEYSDVVTEKMSAFLQA